jgi:hypothetical protein
MPGQMKTKQLPIHEDDVVPAASQRPRPDSRHDLAQNHLGHHEPDTRALPGEPRRCFVMAVVDENQSEHGLAILRYRARVASERRHLSFLGLFMSRARARARR